MKLRLTDIEAIKKRLAACNQGAWSVGVWDRRDDLPSRAWVNRNDVTNCYRRIVLTREGSYSEGFAWAIGDATAELIANAPEDLVSLIEELAEVRRVSLSSLADAAGHVHRLRSALEEIVKASDVRAARRVAAAALLEGGE